MTTSSEQFMELAERNRRVDAGRAHSLAPYVGPAPRHWQSEAIEAWRMAGRRGVVEAVTGTGKTTVGVLAAAEAIREGRRVVVIVPGLDLLDQWVRVLREALDGVEVGRIGGGSKDSTANHRIVVATVHSASAGLEVRGGSLLIADEVHRYGSESFAAALDPAYDWRLGLTATYERTDEGIARHLEPYFGDVVAGCDYRRGLEDGILAPFRVGLIGVDLTPREQHEYDKAQETLAKARVTLIAGYGCPAEPFGEFIKAVQVLSKGGEYSKGAIVARRYLAAFTGRRNVVAESAAKRAALGELVDVLRRAGRGLVFAETVSGATTAARELGARKLVAAAYTSKLNRLARQRLMRAFTLGDIRVLAAPRVLDEGIDVPEADIGVILAASASRRQMVQRIGRIVRPKADGRAAAFFVVYARGTHEDPGSGAHEAFLDAMVDVATTVTSFSSSDGSEKFLEWFLDGRGEDWRPPHVAVVWEEPATARDEVEDYREAAGYCLACRRPVTSVDSLNHYGVCVRCTFQSAGHDECDWCGHPRHEGYLQQMEGLGREDRCYAC